MRPHVTIVGAGPGASDLITLRGQQALRQADVVLYAGSLVSPEQLAVCPPHCRLYDSAGLALAEQVALMAGAVRAAADGRAILFFTHARSPPIEFSSSSADSCE